MLSFIGCFYFAGIWSPLCCWTFLFSCYVSHTSVTFITWSACCFSSKTSWWLPACSISTWLDAGRSKARPHVSGRCWSTRSNGRSRTGPWRTGALARAEIRTARRVRTVSTTTTSSTEGVTKTGSTTTPTCWNLAMRHITETTSNTRACPGTNTPTERGTANLTLTLISNPGTTATTTASTRPRRGTTARRRQATHMMTNCTTKCRRVGGHREKRFCVRRFSSLPLFNTMGNNRQALLFHANP